MRLEGIQQPDMRRISVAVFQDGGVESSRRSSRIVAVTSPIRGEGVSYVSRMICSELSRDTARRTLYCTTEALARLPLARDHDLESLCVRNSQNYWELMPGDESTVGWEFDVKARRAAIDKLTRLFSCVILDCPAVSGSPDISLVANLVSSVLLVVGAGSSTKSQVVHAEQVIVSSGGSLSGCILNRRTYPIPAKLYKLLKGER